MGDSAHTNLQLPLNIVVLLDSLANLEFHKLTKKVLKDRIEEIKVAVAKELAKRSSSNANGVTRENVTSRPSSYAETDDTSNNTQSSFKKPRVSEKPVDRNAPLSRSNASASAKSSSVGLKKGPPPRPSFDDLIKFADKPKDNRKSPERPPHQRSASPQPQRIESSRVSSTKSSRPLSPVNQSRSRAEPLQPKPNGPPRINNNSKVPSNNSRQSSGTNRSTYNEEPRYNAKGDPRVNNVTRDEPRAPRSVEREEKVPKSSKKEPSKSARVKRKDEEERILEEKKRRLREEEERIRLRNQVLAGQVHRANDLKTLVTKSQGSTLLSCGSGGAGNHSDRSPAYSNSQNDRSRFNSHSRDSRGTRDDSVERRNGVSSGRSKDNRTILDHRGDGRNRVPNRDERSAEFRRGPAPRSRPMHMNPYMDDLPISRGSHKRSRYRDYSDEDEDEDLDGFIVHDGDDEQAEVRSTIDKIFNYDRRKYADMSDDDIEEASFAEIEREEKRSARLGRLEDEDAERQELEHQQQKRKRMKAMGR